MTYRTFITVCFLGASWFAFKNAANGQSAPSGYVPQSQMMPAHNTSPEYYTGYMYGVGPRPYAYGWFGVPRRSHQVKQYGWRENYTQWSHR